MSLFDQLRHLYRQDKFPLEDFHTEIVAQVLRDSHALTLAWLRSLGVTRLSDPDDITVATQEEFVALESHASGSRPDLAIRLSEGERTELILVESKVGAQERPDQLKRYAEHLAVHPTAQHVGLVFITHAFEPARAFPSSPARFTFRQTRWFDFFRILKAHANSDGLARQLMLFMKENRMSIRNQFTALDCVALENFLGAKSLMDETLWGEVSNHFAKTLGKVSAPGKAMSQLRGYDRYVMFTGLGAHWDFQCLLGYWMPKDDPSEPVWVGVMLDSNPKSPARADILAGFKEFIKTQGNAWEKDISGGPKAWDVIYKGVALPTFLAQPDHLQTIKTYFLGLLDEVATFKTKYPNLPWAANADDVEAE